MKFQDIENMAPQPDNSPEQEQLRKNRDMLVGSGTGVILFAIWSVVRTIMTFFISAGPIASPSMEGDLEDVSGSWMAVFVLALIFFLAIEVGLRLYIGLSARAEGKGKKKTVLYIVLACILIPIYIAGIVMSVINMPGNERGVFDNIISLAVEITSVGAFIELVVSGIRVKKLQKLLSKDKVEDKELANAG